ncbi:DUF2071 domain-containing protein [Pseudoflavitalea rhizosphaerae]|uniref:DUF2071 domain-containing protein n=1 Tax=Pseudoflavitalea rhizosphaerae TaxID=1884793 RepID=UPI000F8DBC85|nr:DUF2071 domain-containing protein [Pseudoflavitalea rhizosphaerae]
MSKPFLTAAWRNLALINYSVDPAILKPYLPFGVEPDTFNGIHYLSLVGFMFRNTSVMGTLNHQGPVSVFFARGSNVEVYPKRLV